MGWDKLGWEKVEVEVEVEGVWCFGTAATAVMRARRRMLSFMLDVAVGLTEAVVG